MVESVKSGGVAMGEEGSGGGGGYEKLREERMRENMERMQKLGIIDLSQRLLMAGGAAGRGRGRGRSSRIDSDNSPQKTLLPPLPPRRSSRLQNTTPVAYAEICEKKDENSRRKCLVFAGEREEVYTEEHAKLLGSCEKTWTLFVDGYDKDGKRIYDQVNGKTCHQCRQKTLGLHTHCSKCSIVQGQFCGDCLYMRYGENVLEVKKNPSWICPVCRGICNCSLCRTKKGWLPTGSLYRKVTSLGFKSVAHYLIETRKSQTVSGDISSAETGSPKKSLAICDGEGISCLPDSCESENVLNLETADENSNSAVEILLPLNDTIDSSHADQATNGFNVDSCEKLINCSTEEIKLSSVREPSVKRKTKDTAAASPDSIAWRLRSRTGKPVYANESVNALNVDPCEQISNCCSEEIKKTVDGHFGNSTVGVKPCDEDEGKKTENLAVVAILDRMSSRLGKRTSKPSSSDADSCEKVSNSADGHAGSSAIDVKYFRARKKTKYLAYVVSPDCIASRLRKKSSSKP